MAEVLYAGSGRKVDAAIDSTGRNHGRIEGAESFDRALSAEEVASLAKRPRQFVFNHDHPLSRGLEAGPDYRTPVRSDKAEFMMPYGHLRTLRTLLDAVDAVASGEVKDQAMGTAMLKDVAYQTRKKFRLET